MLHIEPNLPMLEEVLLSGQLCVMPILLHFEFNTTLRVSILMKIHCHRRPQVDEKEASGEKSPRKNFNPSKKLDSDANLVSRMLRGDECYRTNHRKWGTLG